MKKNVNITCNFVFTFKNILKRIYAIRHYHLDSKVHAFGKHEGLQCSRNLKITADIKL